MIPAKCFFGLGHVSYRQLPVLMSHHYTTKALGRAWLPSAAAASPRVSLKSRFGSSPSDQSRQRQHGTQDSWFQDLRILRGRLIDRLAVLLAVLISIAFLTYHRDRFISPGVHVWTHSFHCLGLGGSLLPSWSRVDWSSYAYVSYATSPDHVCNSLMLAESLHRLGAKPDTLILYATDLAPGSLLESNTSSAHLLQRASKLYNAHAEPVPLLSSKGDATWAQGFTKLLAFNQTRYKRVLSLDSDATLLQPMDDLFLLPSESKVAMPRAYWLNDSLCAAVMLASPSETEFARIQARLAEERAGEYDMEVMNALYGDSCLVVPHKPFLMLTGEMRAQEHAAYLGSVAEEWDVRKVMGEARYVHFSDYPVPKPWVPSTEALRREWMPACKKGSVGEGAGEENCDDQNAWVWLYKDFRERRKRICGVEFAQWEQAEEFLESLPPMAKGSGNGVD